MPLQPQTGWGLGGREGRAQRQKKLQEDLLFFLLQVKRKQSGKWSMRAVSRRGAPTAPRLPPSRLTRAQRRRSQRPPARAAPAPASRAGTGKRSPQAASGRWGRGPGPGTSGDLGEPRDRLADFSRRVQPVRPGSVRPPASSEPGTWAKAVRGGRGRSLSVRREGCAQLPCAWTACPAERDGGAPGPGGGVRAALPAALWPRVHPPRRGETDSAQPRAPCPGRWRAAPQGAPAAPRGAGYSP